MTFFFTNPGFVLLINDQSFVLLSLRFRVCHFSSELRLRLSLEHRSLVNMRERVWQLAEARDYSL